MQKETSPLPSYDVTPPDFQVPRASAVERLKRPVRRLLYPPYIRYITWLLNRKYATENFRPDYWLWGQRGNDYERLRRRVNSLFPLSNARILIAGCGTGRDIPTWLRFHPKLLVGVDYFSYRTAWEMLARQLSTEYPRTQLAFYQADLQRMAMFSASTFDVIGSDAVFEHLRDVPAVLKECMRILRPGGVIYATFGPLWCCWGGDHISGYDRLDAGYNHLLLDDESYHRYLSQAGDYTHSEHDGRTWIAHNLFSYLQPDAYLRCLADAGFQRLQVGAIVEPRSVLCLNRHQSLRQRLLSSYRLLDLIVTGMTIIYRKPESAR